MLDVPATDQLLPDIFRRWFASRGWTPRAHQLELLAKAEQGRSVLLIAPTGGGKTLAGFLPSLVELYEQSVPRAQRLPLPPRALASGGEGLGVGGSLSDREAAPPTPDPSPPFAARMEGGEKKRKLISTGRGIRREGGLHTLYISPLKALALERLRHQEAAQVVGLGDRRRRADGGEAWGERVQAR